MMNANVTPGLGIQRPLLGHARHCQGNKQQWYNPDILYTTAPQEKRGVHHQGHNALVIPHLVLSHLIADYVLQTDWLANRKGSFSFRHPRLWDGLLLHGTLVWLVSLAIMPEQLNRLWPYITVLALVHTFQDAMKSTFSAHIKLPSVIPYFIDQGFHLTAIILFQIAVTGLVVPQPGHPEITLMLFGSALIGVTRFYEVSWWSNWLAIYPIMRRWRWWSYTERIAILLLSYAGLWWLAPLAVVPRLAATRRQGEFWLDQPFGWADLLLGTAFSVILGLILRTL